MSPRIFHDGDPCSQFRRTAAVVSLRSSDMDCSAYLANSIVLREISYFGTRRMPRILLVGRVNGFILIVVPPHW